VSALADEIEAAVRRVVEQRLAAIEARLSPMQPDDDQALTVQEAADFARYTPETLMERIRAGDLPAHKPKGSREWRVRVGDLRRWLWESGQDVGARGTSPLDDLEARARAALGL
jgi:excisionase family DNA binding protein